MKVSVKKIIEVDAKYLDVDAGVRYWEDGVVNGTEDISYEEQEMGATPYMPKAVKVGNEYRWQITIDLDNGNILDWPKGVEACVHYKVCDDGTYTLLDGERGIIMSKESYVPKILGIGDREDGYGFGDYIIFNVDGDGHITDWRESEIEDLLNNFMKMQSFGDDDE